jgi:hypothetical protein
VIVPLIVFALAAVGLGVWGFMQSQAASSAKVRADALDQRVKQLDADLATAANKATFAEQSARDADQKATEQSRRADQATSDARRSDEMAEDAVKRAIAAERSAAESVDRVARLEVDLVEAKRDRDATLAGAGPFQPEALWRLEVQRIERLWRDRLALQPDEVSPMAKADHEVGAALRILSDASREESGVVVDLMWHVDFDCPPDRCIQLVRLGEELIAAMRDSEGGELEVIGEEDRTIFFLVRTLPPIELPATLTHVLDDFGAMREVADTTVVVRVPARDDEKMAAAAEPEVIEGQEALFPATEDDDVVDLTAAEATETAAADRATEDEAGVEDEGAAAPS